MDYEVNDKELKIYESMGNGFAKVHTIITKEAFIEMYNKWIKGGKE